MPLYEYGCESCGKITEVMQKFSDEPLKDCPECQAPVQKLMSRTSFQLKGSGWYSTDYKKKSGPSGSPAPTTSSSGGGSTATSPASAATPASAANSSGVSSGNTGSSSSSNSGSSSPASGS
jgi:putative FmdB family regulatory protein